MLWIAGGIVALLVIGLGAVFLWDWLTGYDGPLYKRQTRKRMRDEQRRLAQMSDEERAADAKQERSRSLARKLSHGGMMAMMAIGDLTATRDVAGLLSAFSLGDWQTRELVMAAFGNICRDNKPGDDYDAAEMVAALRSIRALCSADSTGGSYRENCLDHANMLLNREELQGHAG